MNHASSLFILAIALSLGAAAATAEPENSEECYQDGVVCFNIGVILTCAIGCEPNCGPPESPCDTMCLRL